MFRLYILLYLCHYLLWQNILRILIAHYAPLKLDFSKANKYSASHYIPPLLVIDNNFMTVLTAVGFYIITR